MLGVLDRIGMNVWMRLGWELDPKGIMNLAL